jgi:outer membrane protein assembly factor BamB
MTNTQSNEPRPGKPLRLWPGIALVTLEWLLWTVFPLVAPGQAVFGILGGTVCGLLVILWWLFFSRAPWLERLAALALMILAVPVAYRFAHVSVITAAQGYLLIGLAIPPMTLALVVWAVASRHYSSGRRRAAMVAAMLVGCVSLGLIRTGGVSGDGSFDLHWRWTPTAEERFLARLANEPVTPPPAPVAPPAEKPAPTEPIAAPPPAVSTPEPAGPPKAPTAAKAPEAKEPAAPAAAAPPAGLAMSERGSTTRAEWPGFRGPGRDSNVRGVRIETDWSHTPPVELWHKPIGPGWSSFAVNGDVFYTQEQRGDDEIVSAYHVKTGAPVWTHRDAARFFEGNAGPGPRGTPAISGDRVFTHGATGIVNALNARDGSVLWSRNSSKDTGAPMPGWGFASSPLVIDDLVVVASSGRLIAYEAATGKPRWTAQSGGGSYGSPQLMTIGGVPQIVLLNGAGVTSFAPADGTKLWNNAWSGAPMLQPTQISDGDLLITSGDAMGGLGTRRIAVAHGPAGWTVEERWTSRGLKPYFNDLVVHKGHAFGFDGSILSCIDLADGERKWKGGRFGHGQLVLLPDQDLLLVLSEDGELALVSATPDKFTELTSRIPAIDGKTWNHPALVGNVLLVRNGEEMAAFRLAPAAAPASP